MTFDEAFKVLIGHEGNFTDNPKDPGNWTGGKVGVGVCKGTKFGIAANTYPNEDIRNLTLARAKALYLRDYWGKLKMDQVPDAVRFDLFDAAVNSGVGQAAKFLQRAAGVVDDGDIGPATLAAVNRMDPQLLDKRMSGHRLRFMADLKVWPDFAKGWARRIANNLLED
jgi:lysozyme family protein